MGYFQIRSKCNVIDAAATTKRPPLSPGTAHNRRAATEPERSPESADEIGCATRRGGRSGWRPSMMNGGGGASPSLPCLVSETRAPKILARPGTRSFTSRPGVFPWKIHYTIRYYISVQIKVIRLFMNSDSLADVDLFFSAARISSRLLILSLLPCLLPSLPLRYMLHRYTSLQGQSLRLRLLQLTCLAATSAALRLFRLAQPPSQWTCIGSLRTQSNDP
jgi:hypothetical protein